MHQNASGPGWLKLKARDARLFLPPGPCTRCDVTEEGPSHVVHETIIADADLGEGGIVNELLEDEAVKHQDHLRGGL